MKPMTPCLWFDDQAEEAAKFYTSIFPELQDRPHHPLRRSREGNPRQSRQAP